MGSSPHWWISFALNRNKLSSSALPLSLLQKSAFSLICLFKDRGLLKWLLWKRSWKDSSMPSHLINLRSLFANPSFFVQYIDFPMAHCLPSPVLAPKIRKWIRHSPSPQQAHSNSERLPWASSFVRHFEMLPLVFTKETALSLFTVVDRDWES